MRKPSIDLPDQMPEKRRTGNTRVNITLRTTTPIYGGGTKTRKVDNVDIIRVPTIRGHLRFWWRALYGGRYRSASELYQAEKAIWGGTTDSDTEGGRSRVEVTARVHRAPKLDASEIDTTTTGAYALWMGQSQGTRNQPGYVPPAERYPAGVEFDLGVTCDDACLAEVLATVRAWVLFGGYGGRTRRGLGSLAVRNTSNGEVQLPASSALAQGLERLLGIPRDGLPPVGPANSTPSLCGAVLYYGPAEAKADDAWKAALQWLQEFRRHQRFEVNEGKGLRAVARVAALGLPLATDKGDLLGMAIATDATEKQRDRFASPLIVKPLALADGKFVPLALWLRRAYPAHARLALQGRATQFEFERLDSAFGQWVLAEHATKVQP